MMNTKLKCLLFGWVCFCMVSCEDFLSQDNPNRSTVGNYWTNLNDCKTGLTAVYNQFRNQSLISNGDEDKRSDMVYPGFGRPKINEYYLHTFNSASTTPNNKWAALYEGILRANQVLEGLEKIKPDIKTDKDIELWTSLKAQARFFRGLFHFYLHSTFNNGSVVIFDFVPIESSDYSQKLSPSDSVIDFFREDLEYAKENLPLTWDGTENLGRVTSGSANAVLGKSYLYQKEYAKAAECFETVIESGVYQLVDVSMNITTKGEFNAESILEIAYALKFKEEESSTSPKGTTNSYGKYFSPVGGSRSNYPSAWLGMAYRQDSIDTQDPRNIIKTDEVTGEPTFRKYSLRTSYSIAIIDDEDAIYYDNTIARESATFKNFETSYFKKNTNWDITDDEKTLLLKSGVNYRLIRLADVYLMYAECLIEGGTNEAKVSQAMEYINKVRNRSALCLIGEKADDKSYPNQDHDEIIYDAQKVMNHLMYIERPLELSNEGHAIRQIDLRRWGITKERFEYLATKEYYAAKYTYVNSKGATIKRAKSWLHEGVDSKNPSYNFKEYEVSAQNYIPEIHDFWPIPISESIANPHIN